MALAKITGSLTAIGVTVAETTSTGLLAILPLLLSGGLLGAVGVLLTVRSRNRQSDADADESHAAAAGDWQTVYRQSIDDLNARVSEQDRQLSRLRDDLRETKELQLKAERELVQAKLDYAELDTRAGKERHDLRDDLAALAVENQNLKTEIAELREQVATLEARAGLNERRVERDRRTDNT